MINDSYLIFSNGGEVNDVAAQKIHSKMKEYGWTEVHHREDIFLISFRQVCQVRMIFSSVSLPFFYHIIFQQFFEHTPEILTRTIHRYMVF